MIYSASHRCDKGHVGASVRVALPSAGTTGSPDIGNLNEQEGHYIIPSKTEYDCCTALF